MQELPTVYDGVNFIEPSDTSKFSPEAMARLDAVRSAWNALQTVEKRIAETQQHINAAAEDVNEATKVAQAFYRFPMDSPAGQSEQQFRLWEQSVKRI